MAYNPVSARRFERPLPPVLSQTPEATLSKRQLLSFAVALVLFAGASAPLSARGVASHDETYYVAAAADEAADLFAPEEEADASKPVAPKRKGNGFVRVIGAPFRALARLFGGGKKKTAGEAAKRSHGPKTRDAAKAAETPRPPTEQPVTVAATTTTTTTVVPAPAAPTSAAPAPSVAPANEAARVSPPAASAQPGVRIVRPAEGVAAADAARPRPWVPIIEGIPKDSLSQGRALLRHGYLSEAIAELSVAATIGPDLAEANNLLGLALDRLGQHKQAIEAYERALSAAPANALVLSNLGYSLYLDDKYSDALKHLKQAARLAPGSPDVLSKMAIVQGRMGKYGDAFKSLTRAFGEYQARIKVGEMLEQAGRTADAVKYYEAALRVEPDSAPLLQRLAELYERAGRAREAEAARRRAGEQPNKQKTATGGGGE